eukprot:TRINITY_DN19813_c0_g1_i2.p1 TRINITY_DN19813_c0_g1~~TRINITY_DN19813_c0_g1_i2.p1  ORF type:complete len:168 (+),score=30.29 TRINITY_DN19813_c0_g1_i2:72-575(+)
MGKKTSGRSRVLGKKRKEVVGRVVPHEVCVGACREIELEESKGRETVCEWLKAQKGCLKDAMVSEPAEVLATIQEHTCKLLITSLTPSTPLTHHLTSLAHHHGTPTLNYHHITPLLTTVTSSPTPVTTIAITVPPPPHITSLVPRHLPTLADPAGLARRPHLADESI